MLLLTVTEFRNNVSKYLKMALTERIALNGKDGIIELTPCKDIRVNPSPSNDSYFDNPHNIKEVKKAMQELEDYHAGKISATSLDELKSQLAL